jgi:hypothetical protein
MVGRSKSRETHKVTDVYGTNREIPLNYVPRDKVDGALVDSLTRDKHIVVFGSSKQGKTSLRKYNLKDDEYIVVTCSNKWTLAELHAAVLKQAGYTIEQSTTRTVSGSNKINAKAGGKFRAGIVELQLGIGGENEQADSTSTVETSLELDPEDVNDIIRALQDIGFDAFIVLEDFHYLSEDTQRDFAVALKAFHEASPYCFIVVGVWLDENRMIQHNGDLTGRVVTVNADAWSTEELREVIAQGEELLNIGFDENFKAELVQGCFDSVYVVQEACYRACVASKIHATQENHCVVGLDLSAASVIKDVIDGESARYNSFLIGYSSGFMDTDLEMYRWILAAVLETPPQDLEEGLSYADLRKYMSENHPRGPSLNPGNLTQALLSTASLQVGKMKIKPIVLDYDQSGRRLNVVDRSFLIWLQYQNVEETLSLIDLEPDPVDGDVTDRRPDMPLPGI